MDENIVYSALLPTPAKYKKQTIKNKQFYVSTYSISKNLFIENLVKKDCNFIEKNKPVLSKNLNNYTALATVLLWYNCWLKTFDAW